MRSLRLSLLGVALLGLWACSESIPRDDLSTAIAGPDAAARSTCDVRDGEAATRSLFGQPEQNEASDLWDAVEASCDVRGVADPDSVFALVEYVSDKADAADGFLGDDQDLAATAVNVALGLLGLDPAPAPVAAPAFGPGGASGVRGAETDVDPDARDVRTRSSVELTLSSEGGADITAEWIVGVLPRDGNAWTDVFPEVTDPAGFPDKAFVWGFEGTDALGNDVYDWNTTPAHDGFDAQVDVIFCVADGGTVDPGDEEARVFKGDAGTVLQEAALLCDVWAPAAASSGGLAFLDALGELFLPQPLHAAAMDFFISIRGVGGGTGDFSPFQPYGANTDGTLDWGDGPVLNENLVVGGPLLAEDLEVAARTGGGAGIELVEVVLSVENNNGVPAGAEFEPQPTELTNEAGGVATFSKDEVLTPNKAGGYRLCAEGFLAGFTFDKICTSEPFNVKNAN